MRSPLQYLLLVSALVVGASLLAACEGEEEEQALSPTSQPTSASTETPGTPAATGDPQDFAEFAGSIGRAVADRDATFFAHRVKGRAYTCSEIDLGPDAWGIVAGMCQEVGQQVEVVEHGYWRSEGILARPLSMAEAIADYFASVLAAESDGYGSGAVQLYATGIARASELHGTYRTAILTAITPVGEAGKPTRTVRGVNFEYVDGRWVITGMLYADVLAEELLSAEAAPYDDWKKY